MKTKILILLMVVIFSSCQNDDGFQSEIGEEELPEEVIVDTVTKKFSGDVLIYKQDKVQDGYVLVNDASNNRAYIIEKTQSEILFEWNLPSGIGNDAELLDNGNLLVALTAVDPAYSFGGYGGRLAIVDPLGNLIWDYPYSDEVNLAHHDLEMLPNGNVLFLAWEKKEKQELIENGYSADDENIYIEKLIEINPVNNEIVWEWNSWDHIVQDVNSAAFNYGSVSDNPSLIDINYTDVLKEGSYVGDIMHANGLEYDETRDLIYLSVNYFSEVWVIDHSTSIAESATSSGGNYNVGGDLVYRFGNPLAYKNDKSDRMFFHNHNPNLVPGGESLLIFSNGIPSVNPHSNVLELRIPDSFNLLKDQKNELDVIWSYSHEDLFSAKVSGAYRLPNGNTLITEGTSGYWEVTNLKEVVWKFEGKGFFWRGYHYEKDSNAILNLGL
tara:strand:- start:2336 stop:3655 length:1320 start_codon:yes stop_codon:yes gene_type:complete